MKDFLKLSEERKKECEWTYSVENVDNPTFQALVEVWDVPEYIERKYTDDYDIIMNNTSGRRICWNDKYSTNLYGKRYEKNFELQPIPDFVSWQQNGELHYLSYEKTLLLCNSELIETPELFLPSRILDNLYVINNTPPDDMLPGIALLSWLPVDDVVTFFKNKDAKEEREYQQDISRESWRNHKLYKRKLPELQQICRKSGLSSKGNKHDLVRSIALHNGEEDQSRFQSHYNGEIKSLPQHIW